MNPTKLLERLAAGSFHNVSFGDFQRLAEAFGWELARVKGSHHIFKHPDVEEFVNLQNHKGVVKPYQLRQFLRLVERYDLRME